MIWIFYLENCQLTCHCVEVVDEGNHEDSLGRQQTCNQRDIDPEIVDFKEKAIQCLSYKLFIGYSSFFWPYNVLMREWFTWSSSRCRWWRGGGRARTGYGGGGGGARWCWSHKQCCWLQRSPQLKVESLNQAHRVSKIRFEESFTYGCFPALWLWGDKTSKEACAELTSYQNR